MVLTLLAGAAPTPAREPAHPSEPLLGPPDWLLNVPPMPRAEERRAQGAANPDALKELARRALHLKDFERGLDAAERLYRVAEESEDRAVARSLQGWLSFYRAFQKGGKKMWWPRLEEATAFFREALEDDDLVDVTARDEARLGLAEALLWQIRRLEPYGLARGDRAHEVLNLAHESLESATTPQIERRARLLLCGSTVCEPARYEDWEEEEEPPASPGDALEETGDAEGDEPIAPEPSVEGPRYLKRRGPQYTKVARKARLEGLIIVRATIEKDGTVSDAIVLRGLPLGLSEATVRAVEKWTFEPATRGGEPVTVLYNLTVNFTLQ